MTSLFLKIDFDLLESPEYQKLDIASLVMYSIYSSRLNASINSAKQGNLQFVDEQGRPFIYFSNDDIAKLLHASRHTVSNLRKKLTKAGLINVERKGLSEYHIYVNDYVHPAKSEHRKTQQDAVQTPSYQQSSRGAKYERRDVQNVNTSEIKDLNNNYINLDKIDSPAQTRANGNENLGHISTDFAQSESVSQPTAKHCLDDFGEIDHVAEDDFEQVLAQYRSQIGPLTKRNQKSMNFLMKKYGARMLCFAINVSSAHSPINPPAYISAILKTADAQGLHTLEAMREEHFATQKYLQAGYDAQNQNRAKFRKQVQELAQQRHEIPNIPILHISYDDDVQNDTAYSNEPQPTSYQGNDYGEPQHKIPNIPIYRISDDDEEPIEYQADQYVEADTVEPSNMETLPYNGLTTPELQAEAVEQPSVESAVESTNIIGQADSFDGQRIEASNDQNLQFQADQQSQASQPAKHEKILPPFSLKEFKDQIFGFAHGDPDVGMA